MIMLSAVLSMVLIAAVGVACWWLLHTVESFDRYDLPHRARRLPLDHSGGPLRRDLAPGIRHTCIPSPRSDA